MSRHKGETTGRMNEREFPHLIELAVPPRGLQEQDLEFEAFHRERGIPIRGGSGRQEWGQFYIRFCFPSAALAFAFRGSCCPMSLSGYIRRSLRSNESNRSPTRCAN
jgi:hypothetical protein